VGRLLRAALVRHGVADSAIDECWDETEAVRAILSAARAGDSLALPVHGVAARERVNALLDRLQAQAWSAGDPVAGD